MHCEEYRIKLRVRLFVAVLFVLVVSMAFAAQAFEDVRKAAEQGNAAAQNNLGALYHSGQGVAKDEKAAAEWFQKAADQGLAGAQVKAHAYAEHCALLFMPCVMGAKGAI